MTKETAFYVAIFSTAAIAIGWHARGYRGGSRDMGAYVSRLAAAKNLRDRSLGTVALVAVISAVVLYVIATRHG